MSGFKSFRYLAKHAATVVRCLSVYRRCMFDVSSAAAQVLLPQDGQGTSCTFPAAKLA